MKKATKDVVLGKIDEEAAILLDGLLLIKEGVLSSDWAKVCQGYYDITLEEIKIPVVEKTKLQLVREKLKKAWPQDVDRVDDEKDDEVDSEVESDIKADFEVAENEGMKVISAPLNKEEQRKNDKLARSFPKEKRQPYDPEKQKLRKFEGDVGFNPDPEPPSGFKSQLS